MQKAKRQLAIKTLIARHAVGTQQDLGRMLQKHGLSVTQATLSRDLRELGVVRVPSPDGLRYTLNPEAEEQRLKPYISYEIEQIEANEYLVVIKTLPGRAAGVAELIDSLHHRDILGTIAGDNTIFVTPRSAAKIRGVLQMLQRLAAMGTAPS
jgi:transcriptional regulator of arginine metabolism